MLSFPGVAYIAHSGQNCVVFDYRLYQTPVFLIIGCMKIKKERVESLRHQDLNQT